jgi:hypothetical protein
MYDVARYLKFFQCYYLSMNDVMGLAVVCMVFMSSVLKLTCGVTEQLLPANSVL